MRLKLVVLSTVLVIFSCFSADLDACRLAAGNSGEVEADSVFAVYTPLAEGKDNHSGDDSWYTVDGIPFHHQLIWGPEELKKFKPQWVQPEMNYLTPKPTTESKLLDSLNILARHLYITGCINSIDMTNPAWGGGDGYRNFFMGDTAGMLQIGYRSGEIDSVPLVFGYTAWWHVPYKSNSAPFDSDPEAQEMLEDALCVINGVDGYEKEPEDYYIRIALRNEIIDWMRLEDNPNKTGFFRVNGMVFGNPENNPVLDTSRYIMRKHKLLISEDRQRWIKRQTIQSENAFPEDRQKALSLLCKKFYTSIEDISMETINKTPPDIHEGNFPGPKVSFEGSPIAALLTRIYYENSAVIMESVDAEGMVHESVYQADNYQSFGSWNEGLGAFYDDAYTRNRSIMVLSNYGLKEKVNKAVDFFDRWMMYYPESYPDIQLGGKPVPGHASVIANYPHIYFDKLRHLGWPTKYKTRDFGNPENDGHGFLMLSRYRAWSKQGKSKEWVLQRWEAIEEAAEYIPWCLENPELSFSEHGLLYNESEGGMQKQSMYCDYLCYLGLLAYTEMAEVAGKSAFSERWMNYANKLYEAMEAYYPTTIAPWGDVWDPEKSGDFVYLNSTLAPACIGMDYHGYNVMKILPDDWVKRTRNTYKMQLSGCRPDFAAPAGMGYGQCYLTQTALLLDEMNDAEKLIEWLARLCFTPRLDHPYRVPEGATISADGKTWRRWGDLGNLYQTVDVVHTLHLMLGVDDTDPKELKLLPRLTGQINRMTIKDWPVRSANNGKSIMNELDLTLDYNKQNKKISLSLKLKERVDNTHIRLGPLPVKASGVTVLMDGKEINFQQVSSGNADWVLVSPVKDLGTITNLSVFYQ